jgi:hypothetical protein
MRKRTGSRKAALPLLLSAFAAAAAAGAQTPPSPADPAPAAAAPVVARDGKHYRVEFHGGPMPESLAGRIADDALAAAESGWPLLDRRLGVKLKAPPVLHVFTDRAEYIRNCKAAADARWVTRGECMNGEATAGFVQMTPALSTRLLAIAGLPWPTCCAVLRLAMRAAVAQQLPGVDPNEDWTVTLLTLSLSEETVAPGRKDGVDAERDTRRYSWAGACGREQKVKDLVENLWVGQRTDLRENGLAVLAEFLHVADQGASRRLLAMAKKHSPSRAEAQRKAAEAILGEDWGRNQDKWVKFVGGLHPVWEVPAPMFDLRGPRWLLASGTKQPLAHAYRMEDVPAGGYTVHCIVELAIEDTEFRVLLDTNPDKVLLVSIVPAGVHISDWETGDKLTEHAAAERAFAVRKAYALDIDDIDGCVRVGVDGQEVCTWKRTTAPAGHGWGIAADGAAWVSDLRCRALGPPKK